MRVLVSSLDVSVPVGVGVELGCVSLAARVREERGFVLCLAAPGLTVTGERCPSPLWASAVPDVRSLSVLTQLV